MIRQFRDRKQSKNPKPEMGAPPPPEMGVADVSEAPEAPLAEEPLEEVRSPRRRRSLPANWLWSMVWLVMLMLAGGTVAGTLYWLVKVPPAPDCSDLSQITGDSARLYCAERLARSGEMQDLMAGINLVKDWPADHPLYDDAQNLLGIWSEMIFSGARQQMAAGNLEEAIADARQIPPSSPLYSEAQAAIAAWQKNWDAGEKLANQMRAALKAQNWRQATQVAEAMLKLDNDYWRDLARRQLDTDFAAEKQARRLLQGATARASANTVDALKEAIALARQVTPDVQARADAQSAIARWSRDLLKLAQKRLDARDLSGAIAAAEAVPEAGALRREANDFMLLARADAMTWQDSWFGFLEAQAAALRIPPDSPLRSQAQAKVARWRTELQNVSQLQLAQATADFLPPLSWAVAIDQAQMVPKGAPRRLEAQTLVAHLRKETLVAEDRPFLVLARRLAATATVESLDRAIAVARQVQLGRPLRIEAQTLIAQWNLQIQVIEDQPVLDQARSLARQGDLSGAIAAAEKIQSGRALYNEAQADIDAWVYEIRLVEDRAIFREAQALANQGRLSDAIVVASDIGPGRPLYGEAQASIGQWAAERDAILRERARPVEPPPAPAPEDPVYFEEPAYFEEPPPPSQDVPPPPPPP